MSHKSDSDKRKFRLTVKLDYEWDANIIRWIEAIPEGYRSEAVRNVIRHHLNAQSTLAIDDIRRVVSEELGKVLINTQIRAAPVSEPQNDDEAEAKYGAKLDQMLGGLTSLDNNQVG